MPRLAWLTVLLAVAIAALTACGTEASQVERSEGPCTIDLRFLDRPGHLTPPYVVELEPRPNAPDGSAELTYWGSFWTGMVAITVTRPDGRVEEAGVSSDRVREGAGLYLDAPGTWWIEFESEDGDCVQEFAIEAR